MSEPGRWGGVHVASASLAAPNGKRIVAVSERFMEI